MATLGWKSPEGENCRIDTGMRVKSSNKKLNGVILTGSFECHTKEVSLSETMVNIGEF